MLVKGATDIETGPRSAPARAWFYYNGLILIPERISNYIHYKAWDETIYPLSNFKVQSLEIGTR